MKTKNFLKRRYLELSKELSLDNFAEDDFLLFETLHSQAHRFHHDLTHIYFCVNTFDKFKGLFNDPVIALYSLFWHDAYYQPFLKMNEEASLELATGLLMKSTKWFSNKYYFTICGLDNSYLTPVGHLRENILATMHTYKPDDSDARLVADIDKLILAAPFKEYMVYANNIEKEYLPNPTPENELLFVNGRLDFLRGDSLKPFVFFNHDIQDTYERQAVDNINQEIELLENRLKKF